jgi:hypothetical protein
MDIIPHQCDVCKTLVIDLRADRSPIALESTIDLLKRYSFDYNTRGFVEKTTPFVLFDITLQGIIDGAAVGCSLCQWILSDDSNFSWQNINGRRSWQGCSRDLVLGAHVEEQRLEQDEKAFDIFRIWSFSLHLNDGRRLYENRVLHKESEMRVFTSHGVLPFPHVYSMSTGHRWSGNMHI